MIVKLIAKAVLGIAIVMTTTASANLEAVSKKVPKTEISANDLNCLAQNIYFEARNQSQLGQIAVAHVVLNRVKDEAYPNSICGVVKQAKLTSDGKIIKHRCQFSWFCDGTIKIPRDKKMWESAKHVAYQALKIYKVKDVTNGSTFYHATYVKPSWSKQLIKTLRIDDHIFYKRHPV